MQRHSQWAVFLLTGCVACSGAAASSSSSSSGAGDDTAGGGGGEPELGDLGDAGATQGCSPDPANFEVPSNGCDDDGDGTVDNANASCDTALDVTGAAE